MVESMSGLVAYEEDAQFRLQNRDDISNGIWMLFINDINRNSGGITNC